MRVTPMQFQLVDLSTGLKEGYNPAEVENGGRGDDSGSSGDESDKGLNNDDMRRSTKMGRYVPSIIVSAPPNSSLVIPL